MKVLLLVQIPKGKPQLAGRQPKFAPCDETWPPPGEKPWRGPAIVDSVAGRRIVVTAIARSALFIVSPSDVLDETSQPDNFSLHED
jgi:hypothetical protein